MREAIFSATMPGMISLTSHVHLETYNGRGWPVTGQMLPHWQVARTGKNRQNNAAVKSRALENGVNAAERGRVTRAPAQSERATDSDVACAG